MSREKYDENCNCEDCSIDRDIFQLIDKIAYLQKENEKLRVELQVALDRFIEHHSCIPKLDNNSN